MELCHVAPSVQWCAHSGQAAQKCVLSLLFRFLAQDDTLPFLCIPWLKTGTKRSSEAPGSFSGEGGGCGTRVHGLDTLTTIGLH